MNSEEAFLYSTFKEFFKCWKSGTNAHVFIESVNGRAFVPFSTFLGFPEDVHFKPRQRKRDPSKGPRKKSANKIKRDNDRAARFHERKRKEEEAASASKSADTPEAFISPSPGLESVMTISDYEFSFASPTPENLRQDTSQSTSMIVNDNIEDRKQDEAFNYSSLEFQVEEEEIQEHSQSLPITERDDSLNTSISVAQEQIQSLSSTQCQEILKKYYELEEKQAAARAANLTVVPAPPTIHHHSPPAPMITPAAASTTIHHHTYAPPASVTRDLLAQIPSINPHRILQLVQESEQISEQRD